MKHKLILALFAFVFTQEYSYAQKSTTYTWWNPVEHDFNVIEGQAWTNNLESKYDRLPKKAKTKVRTPLWNLSKHSAGLSIRFNSNASEFIIKYKVNGKHAMPHMPTTGVSGVDLYAKDSEGKWSWCRGNYSFGDTIKYHFKNISPKEKNHAKGREYHLFLPLYNSVKHLEIGIPETAIFTPLATRKEKPIVTYGTSIMQGACASRPGMAWTSILQRKMERPLINLGFSGNGRLEEELIDLMTEIDAKIYVLDCLPNLSPNKKRTVEEVHRRIIASVKSIRIKRPLVPILLVEHGGYSDGITNKDRRSTYSILNKTIRNAFAQLKNSGVSNLHLLTKKEIGLSTESFVDGTHPSDLGMMQYALAYEKSIRKILNEPIGVASTTIPVTQAREPNTYIWEQRHQQLLQNNSETPVKICWFGDSITHYWSGTPKAPISNGSASWDKYFKKFEIRNFGFGWDRIENVLWRIYHDELEAFKADKIVLMIGTNNLHLNTNQEIIEGLKLTTDAIKHRQSNAKILLVGILPRHGQEKRIANLNQELMELADLQNIEFTNIGTVLLQKNAKIDSKLFLDGLHPNEKGYTKLAKKLKKHF